jgi:phosphomannomutase
MLDVTLEEQLTRLINMNDQDYAKAVEDFERDHQASADNILVHIGWDTRPSSQHLALAVANAVEQTGVKFVINGKILHLLYFNF